MKQITADIGRVGLQQVEGISISPSLLYLKEAMTTIAPTLKPAEIGLWLRGHKDKIIRVWDVASSRETHHVRGALYRYRAHLAFSRDGKRLASGSYDRSIRIWDPAAGKELGKLTGHKATIRALAFSANGKSLASGSADHKVRLWDLETMKSKAVLSGHEGSVRAVAFSPDGEQVV